MPFTLISFPFDQDTPNLIDPADDGVLVHSLTPGEYVEGAVIYSTKPNANVESHLVLSPDSSAFDALLYVRGPGDFTGNNGGAAAEPHAHSDTLVVYTTTGGMLAKALDPTNVYLYLQTNSGTPTVLAGEVVLKIYS